MRPTKETEFQLKRKFLIERLTKMNVKTSQCGKSIYDLDYETLKYELVLLSFREIDAEISENEWF